MPTTDEDIVRDLLHRYTSHVQPRDSIATAVIARQRRRDRNRRRNPLCRGCRACHGGRRHRRLPRRCVPRAAVAGERAADDQAAGDLAASHQAAWR